MENMVKYDLSATTSATIIIVKLAKLKIINSIIYSLSWNIIKNGKYKKIKIAYKKI